MIRELRIRNLAIIDELNLEFGPGLNVLTGETGAGKSIILGALRLVLGERAESDDVRTSAESAEVEALVDGPLPDAARTAIMEAGAPFDPEGIVLRREVSSEGRSKSIVNGRLAPLRAMAALGRSLVDLHGQHQHQSLLDPQTHLASVDAFAECDVEAEATAAAHAAWAAARRSLADLQADERALEREKAMLQFQVEEIGKAALHPDEEEGLASERLRLRNAEQLRESATRAHTLLQEGPSEGSSALDLLSGAAAEVSALARLDPAQQPLAEGLAELRFRLDDISRQLLDYASGAESNPARLAEIEDRLNLIRLMKKKYGASIPEILAAGEGFASRLDTLVNRDVELARLEQRRRESESALVAACVRLSEKRKKAARAFETRLKKELSELQMEGAQFRVDFQRESASGAEGIDMGDGVFLAGPAGVDRVEFLISTNVGEAVKPLRRVASGGELSRIMLAIKSLLARRDAIPTLVFDEIDVGISGATAHVVGEKMRRLAESHQVICITHLPQIAARASRHFSVDKCNKGKRVTTVVRSLGPEERVEEITRLLGGDPASAIGRRHAEELLAKTR